MRYSIALLALLIFQSCLDDRPEFTSVTVEEVFRDSLSIRAIQAIDPSAVWFAANNGRVGLLQDGQPKLATIRYEDSLLHFRSLAALEEAVFVLSIGDPGVLYRIGFNGEEASSIEEVYTERGPKVFYDAMAFWDEQEGIAMGDPVDDCLSVIVTRDAGRSWTKISCDRLPEVLPGEAAFAASNTNIALYGDHVWIVSGGKKARVFHSSDRAKTWEVYDTPILQGGSMTGIYSVDFYDDQVGVIFGGDWERKEFNEGNKAITFDGGKTWELLSNGSGPGYRSCVQFVPGSQGKQLVAVGSPGISYSSDQGSSWSELSSEGFYAISFVNDSLAYASGYGRIARLLFE